MGARDAQQQRRSPLFNPMPNKCQLHSLFAALQARDPPSSTHPSIPQVARQAVGGVGGGHMVGGVAGAKRFDKVCVCEGWGGVVEIAWS